MTKIKCIPPIATNYCHIYSKFTSSFHINCAKEKIQYHSPKNKLFEYLLGVHANHYVSYLNTLLVTNPGVDSSLKT